MKYTYAYKTSDGMRHEAAMDAPSREVVFAELRKHGIKAIKVVAADGSKANGEVRGVRKRAVAALVALVALGVGVVAYKEGTRSVASVAANGDGHAGRMTLSFLSDQTRRQVIGDAAIIEKGIRTGWSDVFPHMGDRFLASFAIPGVKAGVGTTSVATLEAVLKEQSPHRCDSATNCSDIVSAGMATAMKSPLGIEAQQIMSMVEGMKREARAYLAAGGKITDYGKRLTERQDAEIAVFKRAEAEVLAAQKTMSETSFTKFCEQRNDELRNLGIRPITLPE